MSRVLLKIFEFIETLAPSLNFILSSFEPSRFTRFKEKRFFVIMLSMAIYAQKDVNYVVHAYNS